MKLFVNAIQVGSTVNITEIGSLVNSGNFYISKDGFFGRPFMLKLTNSRFITKFFLPLKFVKDVANLKMLHFVIIAVSKI